MKFDDFSQSIVNLSDSPSESLIPKLAKGDTVLYDGKECKIDFAPKKYQGIKGVWIVGLEEVRTKKKFAIKLVSSEKPTMTVYEKKVYKRNIKAIVKQFQDDEERLIEIIKNYHWNMASLNNYADENVRECLSVFPVELLKKSGIII